ncbi:MAG TPA: GNAT family N-acetyltransferase [Solirubrobacterales bacterium]|nr:GNAT family N-acetyltransferase [Solirubrobacterales bacterium]
MAPQLRQLVLPLDDRLFRAVRDFDCLGEGHRDDPVAENVNGFLAEGRFLPSLEQGISSTYLLLDPKVNPILIGYSTLTFDSVRLTNAERRQMEELIGIAEFGALRIQMIGIDRRHQGQGHGRALLGAITGLARRLSQDVALRFLLADANVRKVGWYESHGFVANRAARERNRTDPERSISMRFDLLDALRDPEPEDRALLVAALE